MKKNFLIISFSLCSLVFSQTTPSDYDNSPPPSAPARDENNFVKVSDVSLLKRILSGKLDVEHMALKPDHQADCSQGKTFLGSKIVKDLNLSNLKNTEHNLKSTVYLEIDEKGKISGFVIDGNDKIFNEELEKAVRKNLKEKCTPALIKTKPVKSLHSFPVNIVI